MVHVGCTWLLCGGFGLRLHLPLLYLDPLRKIGIFHFRDGGSDFRFGRCALELPISEWYTHPSLFNRADAGNIFRPPQFPRLAHPRHRLRYFHGGRDEMGNGSSLANKHLQFEQRYH